MVVPANNSRQQTVLSVMQPGRFTMERRPMKIETACLFLTCLVLCMTVGSTGAEEKAQSYSGILNRKPWTKSAESFCAGGSDYLVLETPIGPQTIGSNRLSDGTGQAVSRDELLQLVGKNVTIEATPRTVTVKCDMMRQQCMDWKTKCTYLEVSKITKQ